MLKPRAREGKRALMREEVEQIRFRLALGHGKATVTVAVD